MGALLSGYIGDTFGAKKALTVSIFLMAIPTVSLGCLPTYKTVGYLATVLLILCRMMQGLAVGKIIFLALHISLIACYKRWTISIKCGIYIKQGR